MPELTEEQLTHLQQWANLGQALVGNKKTKVAAEKLVKMLDPNIETSEDAAEPLLAPMRDELADVRKQLKTITDGAAAYNEGQKFVALREAGYTDEGVEKIKEIMKTEGISNPHVAAAYFEKTNPPKVDIRGVSSQNFGNDIFGIDAQTSKDKLDKLFNDTDSFIADEVRAIEEEFRNQ